MEKRTRTPAQLASDAARSQKGRVLDEAIREHILAARERGITTDHKTAAYLNRMGLRTFMNQRWSNAAVHRLRVRLRIPRADPAGGGE
jgi:hypothetical protein